MKTKRIPSSDFDFDGFFDTIVDFIEKNFGDMNPIETLQYFYSFEQDNPKNYAFDKDIEKWGLEDFQNAVLQRGETVYFPFSSYVKKGGIFNLANRESIQLSAYDDGPRIARTDCFGFLVNVAADEFLIESAIAWGGRHSTIESASHSKIDKAMNEFLQAFIN